MKVPYENTSAGMKARNEISKILENFGCESVGFMDNHKDKELILMFTHMGRSVQLKASAKGWAALWLRHNPWSHRRAGTKDSYEQKALTKGMVAVNSILRDWVKGQVTAVECGIMSFDHVFMSHIVLADGRTVFEHASAKNLLPPPEEK